MPERSPLIPHIGYLSPVYDPFVFKTLEWALSQTWDVPCVTRIGLFNEFSPPGMKMPFSYLRVELTNYHI